MIAVSANHDEAIRQVAVERLGVTDTSIVRHVDPRRGDEGGVWLLLSVRLPGDTEWKLLGRRRTKAELLQLVETLDPAHLDGKHFYGPIGRDR